MGEPTTTSAITYEKTFLEALSEGQLEIAALCVAAPTASAIFISNLSKWRALPPARRGTSNPHARVVLFSLLLAVLCLINAILAVADRWVPLYLSTFEYKKPTAASQLYLITYIPSMAGGIIFCALASISLTADVYLTWMWYVLSQTILERPLPRWKVVVAQGKSKYQHSMHTLTIQNTRILTTTTPTHKHTHT